MADEFKEYQIAPDGPANRSELIVPAPTELARVPRCVLLSADATIVGQLRDDNTDNSFVLRAGYHPLRFKIVKSITAGSVIGLY